MNFILIAVLVLGAIALIAALVMWHQEANFISCKPAFVRSFGFKLRYANRECKQDTGTYGHRHNTNLRKGDKY